MPVYSSPGVYIQEVPPVSVPFGGVSTSTAGFIGCILPDSVPTSGDGWTLVPLFKDAQGNPLKDKQNKTIGQTTAPSGKKVVQVPIAYDSTNEVYTTNTVVLPAPGKPKLFTNFLAFARKYGDLTGDIGIPELAYRYTVTKANYTAAPVLAALNGWRALVQAVYGFFANGGTRCWVAHVETADVTTVGDVLNKQFAAIDEIAIIALPGITNPGVQGAAITHCATLQDRFVILDPISTITQMTASDQLQPGKTNRPGNSAFAALYFPRIRVADPSSQVLNTDTPGSLLIGPSGHIAGMYARVDAARGAYKAPANEVLSGVLDLEYRLTRNDQDGLNPNGINVIRNLNGNLTVWGARTLGGDANGIFRYISTRRYFSYLCKTIEQNTQFVVFEPNTPGLWQRVTRAVSDFLLGEWRGGGLFGETPKSAFSVKCDAETNPDDVRERGQLIIQVGVAIVKPAEFVIFQIQQTTG